jgi:hypothetical protein
MFGSGWEQLIGLFRFYVHFHKKLNNEVQDTINALRPLIVELKQLTSAATPKE